ncbi:MAG TPA: hypothetical protein VGS12_04000 [Caulobacteraceae bacterium]|nr:hypothetical protein [Caulobacteraceae bacterium]
MPTVEQQRTRTEAYLDRVLRRLWAWADEHHGGELEPMPGGFATAADMRKRHPPVLKPEFADLNVVVTGHAGAAKEIRQAITKPRRHQWYRSLRSSQALAQSVFGAIKVCGRLDLLSGVTAECGRLAFFDDHRGWSLGCEEPIRTLGEPARSRTSIDVMLSGPGGARVAVECKFTESEFGRCSRPRLRPKDPGYAAQRCDGCYHAQAGRAERCALTAANIRYWDYLPSLFAWPKDADLSPCTFGRTYQLARNALAATVMPDGTVDRDRGHVLVVYDANNPEFQAGGTAQAQFDEASAACLESGLLRRLSWQRLMAPMARDAALGPLVDKLHAKYGFDPT